MKLIAILILLFLILILLLSIPTVQTSLGKYVTDKVNEKYGTNINIDRVGIQFNGDVELKDILIKDHYADTLVAVKELNTSVISFKNLSQNKFSFGDIDVYDLYLNIKTYKGEKDSSLDIFTESFDSDQKSENKFLLSSSDVSIENSIIKVTDQNKEKERILLLKNFNLNATNFVIFGPDVTTRVNTLNFIDARGVEVNNMSANFKYSLSEMRLDDLKIVTDNSDIKADLIFKHNRGLRNFTDSVQINAKFNNSKVYLNELNKFYNEFGVNQYVNFSADITGTLNNMNTQNVQLKGSRRTELRGDLNFKNLFNKEENNFVMDAEFEQLSSTYTDLKSMLPNVLGNALPSSLERLDRFTIKGNSQITSKTVLTDIEIATSLGIIISDLQLSEIDDIDNALYVGNIILDEFDVGQFIEDKNVGKMSLNADVNGRGFTLENLNTLVEGDIYNFSYNDYYYSDVDVSGTVINKIFNGKLETQDEHVDLDFNGLIDFTKDIYNYDFVADVRFADLNALNFVERDSVSVFKGLVDMKMQGTSLDNAVGSVNFKNTLYKNQEDEYYFEDFSISSSFKEDIRTLKINSPDIIEGELKGRYNVRELVKLTENSLGSLYNNYSAHVIGVEQVVDFNFKIYSKIAEVFYPELNFGSNTTIRGHIESNAKNFNILFRSPKISFEKNQASDIRVTVDNNNPLFNTLIEVAKFDSDTYNIKDFSLVNVTKNDTLYVRSEFNGGKTYNDHFDLNMYYTINKDKKSVVGFDKSKINFKGNDWFINESQNRLNTISFKKDFTDIVFSELKMTHQNEKIELNGKVIDALNKDIDLSFNDIALEKVLPEIDNLSLEGNLNGNLDIVQTDGAYLPQSNMVIDNLKVNEVNLGSFDALIKGNESLTNYLVNIGLKNDTSESLRIYGDLDVISNNSRIDLDVAFDRFSLVPLNPFGGENITNIRGLVNGKAKVIGSLSRPDISGELTLNNAGMSIPYLNIDYKLEDDTKVKLSQQSFNFINVQLTDNEFFSKADLNGSVSHVNFSNWALDLHLDSDRLLVLNTVDDDEKLYYGTAFVDGSIDLVGPTDQLVIGAEVASEEGTIFKIPLKDTQTLSDVNYIHFLSPEEKRAQAKGEEITIESIKGLELDFDLTVNENADIEIVIDKSTGSTIRGKGNGGLLAQINTNGKFNMFGDFFVTEGTYNFNYQGVIQKAFKVKPGGTLLWEGDPLSADINIQAVYDDIEANPSILLDNPINRSIPVEVQIDLTGSLEQPNLDYQLSFPRVNSNLNSELQYRLNDKASREFQAISLLVTGSFRNDLSNLGTSDIYGLVSDRINAILNDLISSDGGNLDFNFAFEAGENNPDFQTGDRFITGVSAQISDKILVNGRVGVPIGGVTETVVAGDVEIQVLLNEERTLTLNIFNRENTIRNFGEQIGYTQGIGVSWNVEFDNFKELMHKLFKPNEKKTIIEEEQNSKDDQLPSFINMVEKDTTTTQQKIKRNN